MNRSFFIWLATSLLTVQLKAETIHFDKDQAGAAPSGWTAAQTGVGSADWAAAPDDSAPSQPNVLKQSGTAAYPICLKDDPKLKDGFVEVKFKPVSGKEDQAGGVVWRAQDNYNYYVCLANALEDNVTLYKTVGGKRTALDIVGRKGGYGIKQKVTSAQWHTLRVEFSGTRFTVFFEGKKMFEVEDGTFAAAGKVGVWTKADSVTLFDEFAYGP